MFYFNIACYLVVVATYLDVLVAPPVRRKEKQAMEDSYKTEGLPPDQAQDQEYFRYLTQVRRFVIYIVTWHGYENFCDTVWHSYEGFFFTNC